MEAAVEERKLVAPANGVPLKKFNETLLVVVSCLAIGTTVFMRGIRKRKFSKNVDETGDAATGLSTFAEFAHK